MLFDHFHLFVENNCFICTLVAVLVLFTKLYFKNVTNKTYYFSIYFFSSS